MSKINNMGSNDFTCQICKVNEAILEIRGSGFLHEIQGKFCQPCSLERIRDYYKWSEESKEKVSLKRKVDLVNSKLRKNGSN